MKEELKSCGTCTAVLLCVIGVSVIIAPKVHLLAAMFEDKPVVAPEPIDIGQVEAFMILYGADLSNMIGADYNPDPFPDYASMMDADAPEAFIEFDLKTGMPGRPCSLRDATESIAVNVCGCESDISQRLYAGECVKVADTGYIRQTDYPEYFYANFAR